MSENYRQAPKLNSIGSKDRQDRISGFAMRNHQLEAAIANCLGERDFAAYKVMMFLTGNAADIGFRVAEKTILTRMNISERSYVSARKKLIDMGWIEHESGKHITVNYDKIYDDYDILLAARGEITSSLKKSPTNKQTELTSPQRDELTSSQNSFRDELTSPHRDEVNTGIINNEYNKDKYNKEKEINVSFAALCAAPSAAPVGSVGKSLFELRKQMDNEWMNQKCKQDALLLVDEWWNAAEAQLIDWYGADYQESGYYSDKMEYRNQITDKINNYTFSRN